MFIGNFNGRSCTVGTGSPNKSICVTGLSGSGKTCRLNQIELANTNDNTTIIVLDMAYTHTEDQILPSIRKKHTAIANRINAVKDGIDLCIFQPIRNEKNEVESPIHLINSAVEAFSASQNFGVRQIAALREAVIDAIKYRADFESDVEALDFCLSIRDDITAETVRQRLWGLLNCRVLRTSKKQIKSSFINILDFSGVDESTKALLAELTLASIWRSAQYGNLRAFTGNLLIVLDEFQNLPLKKDAVLRSLLREGRKFGISLVLATQTLAAFPKDVLALLDQSATKLYFRPAQSEARKIAKEIGADDQKEFAEQLVNLKVGECIAVGDLCIGGTPIRRPVLLR